MKPDPAFRKGVGQPKLVAINGTNVKGTRSVIRPGSNKLKTEFRWPNGQAQEVALNFHANPGSVYHIYYDLFPLSSRFQSERAESIVKVIAGASDPCGVLIGAVVLGPAAAAVAIGERIHHHSTQHQPDTYLDLMVVAQDSGEGIVKQVRLYPGGKAGPIPSLVAAQ